MRKSWLISDFTINITELKLLSIQGYLVLGISDVFITNVNVCQIRYYSIIRHGSRHAPRAVYKENDGTRSVPTTLH